MAEELTALASAPVLEEYIGPVLFTQQASAELFTRVLAPHLSGERPPLSNIPQNFGITTFSSKLTQRFNRKILPKEISIIDNPLQADFNQAPFIGSYNIDDEGVAAKPVNLVEKGILKTLLMSRRPREEISQSNGHGRSSLMGNPGTQIGNLLITTEKGKTYQELKKELLELCTDQGLDFGLIIKTVDNPAITGMEAPGSGPGSSQTESALTTPVIMVRVYVKDGREELVRGLTVSELSVSHLKDITAVGKDYYVLNRMVAPAGTITGSIFTFYITRAGASMTIPASIVAPSVLFEELEFKKSEEKRQKTPLMTHPFFGK
jgi:predicted Zn-dependent protease